MQCKCGSTRFLFSLLTGNEQSFDSSKRFPWGRARGFNYGDRWLVGCRCRECEADCSAVAVAAGYQIYDVKSLDRAFDRERALEDLEPWEPEDLLTELCNLGTSDIYTDAPEYRERVGRIKELFEKLGRRVKCDDVPAYQYRDENNLPVPHADDRTGNEQHHRMMHISDRQMATLLAALRYWQIAQEGKPFISVERVEGIEGIATNCGTLEKLTPEEIDALCIELNMGGGE